MRPQTQALIDKLRKITILAEPGTAEEVIYDIAKRQLYDKKQEVRLANIAQRLQHLWISMRGSEDIYGVPEPTPEPTPAPEPGLGGDRPSLDLETPELKKTIKEVIWSHAIAGHKGLMIQCGCNREFAADEEWANHVRIRVWRALKAEFPPIGTEEK